MTAAPAGTTWAVGTEINLVNRLNEDLPDKHIFCLDPVICPCSTMYRVHPAYILWTLEHLAAGNVVNQITVDEKTARTRWSPSIACSPCRSFPPAPLRHAHDEAGTSQGVPALCMVAVRRGAFQGALHAQVLMLRCVPRIVRLDNNACGRSFCRHGRGAHHA